MVFIADFLLMTVHTRTYQLSIEQLPPNICQNVHDFSTSRVAHHKNYSSWILLATVGQTKVRN